MNTRQSAITALGPESPRLLSLTFTHILQIDCVKRPEERIVIADWFTVSTVLIRFTSGPKKDVGKNQAEDEWVYRFWGVAHRGISSCIKECSFSLPLA